jgi:hypothetical protein
MTEEQTKEYVVNGGKLFIIKSIDTIRDGGTKVLDTTGGKFYIHKDSRKFHSGYVLSDENLITDFLLIEYLIERTEKYINRCEDDVKWNKNLLLEIQNKK